ncbi:MAG: PD40 domain-containing protein [Rubrobacter sp.]|nr:PD40 domain-containing protein [Rubrobacter sp.]
MSTRQEAQLAITDETRQEGSRAMTIQTNIRELIGSIEKMKALAAGLLTAAMMAASLLAPTPAEASAFPGANGKIVFTSSRTTGTGVNNPEGDFEIFTMNPDGTGLKQLTKNKASDVAPSYSSDGKKIVFASVRTGNFETFTMNSDGTGQTNLTNNPATDARPSFSPDGKKILFDSTRAGVRDVFVMNSNGSGQTRLTTDPAGDSNATFSPKGDKIAFVSDRGSGDQEIFIMNSDGTQQTALTATDTATEDDPTFSPDGSKIAFSSNRSGGGDFNDFDIFVMNSNGSSPINFTPSTARDDEPAYSPDGKKIAFVSTRDGGDEDVFVMEASGGAGQTDITPNSNVDITPDWQPTATTFTVTTASDGREGFCGATCTLRDAIGTSNVTPGPGANTIKFDIPGSGVQTITPLAALPQITRPVVIDGYTQPGASPNTLATGDNAALKIELNGTNVGGGDGLAINNSSGSVIKGLAINRFGTGIDIFGDSVANRIEGNFIGTDPTGTLDRGNQFDAVGIGLGPSENVVGGSTPAVRNVISGNDDTGIFVNTANGNQIQGNYVGTDKSGTKDLGNIDGGVVLTNGSDNNVVGGTTAGARNVVSGNADGGVTILSGTGNKVLGNRVGTTANGTGALGNDIDGVFIQGSNNLVGDGTPAGSNTIAFNGKNGVAVGSSGSAGNAISRNSIFSNTGLGIDLRGGFEDATGKTANDPGDIDTGANGLQNFPVLASAKTVSGKTTVTGKLNSTPSKTFKVQFYSNPSGNEGKKFIGEKSVTTDGSGNASFTFFPATAVSVGQTITATATDPGNNTSEFSAARKVASS